MSGELVPKPRLVRCPKCQLLLQEPLGCDLYKCGECGTTLQAKKRTSVPLNSESRIKEIDAAPRNALTAKTTTTSSTECHFDGNVGKGQNENGECNMGQLVPCIVSDEGMETELDIYKLSHRRHRVSNKGFSTSYKMTHSEIEEIHDENLLEESKEESAFAWDEGINEGDLEGKEDELISESDGKDANKDKSTLAGANPEAQSTGSDVEGAKDLNNGNLLQEGSEEELSSASDGVVANYDQSVVGENLEVEITGSNIAQELNNESLELEGAENALDGGDSKNDKSAIEGAKPEVDTTESSFTTKRSSRENSGSILHVTPGKLGEGKSSNPVSSNKQQKQAQKNVHRGSNRVRSVDTSDTTEIVDHSSELSGVAKLSKSPTTRSSCAYEGSPSFYDGMGDRFPIQHSGSFDNTYTIGKGVSEGRIRKGKGVANSSLHRDLETQHQSHLPNAKHHSTKDNRGTQNKVLETTRHGHRRWMRTKRDEFPPKIPFQRSGSHSHYESGGTSNQIHDEVYHSTSFLSPDSFEDTDQEKMTLRRMIHKLQDQLHRTRYMSGETNGRLSKGVSYKGNHVSSYHSLDLREGRRLAHGLNYPSCNGRCSHGVNWHQRHDKFSRIPYSAEATSSAHHVDHTCYLCCSQERNLSTDLPPHVLFQHEELHRSYPGLDCCSFSHHSYPSSPQWFTKHLPVYGHEIKSNDQRHRAPDLRKYLRQKKNFTKRHQRPVAGGAPFITCPKCFKLLQLPADFILFKRACHQLICGECSELLKFSLHGSHIVYFSPNNAVVPPSCDLNDQSEVISSSNVLPAAHANYYQYSPAEPISYYDDYGLSVSKSYSSEGEPVSLAQFHTLHGSEHHSRSVSRGTFEPSKEETNAPRCSSLRKVTVETDESATFSTNLSAPRKLSTPPKASLHQLMGYSSPSQVIRGARSSV